VFEDGEIVADEIFVDFGELGVEGGEIGDDDRYFNPAEGFAGGETVGA
jgi:hypothetical protein